MPVWWDDARIETAVTRSFVCSKLIPSEIERLDSALAFGDGLTDETYWEWLDGKAKKLFLILCDLGIPDQIFGLIDDSYDDGDLPVALEGVERLQLTADKDEKMERRFFRQQYMYLLRHVKPGEHIDYDDDEVVPVEVLDRMNDGINAVIQIEKVSLSETPGMTLCRRRIPIGNGAGCMTHDELLDEVGTINGMQHKHLVSYYASYTHKGFGYVLLTPVSDCTFKAFLQSTPSSVKMIDKHVRRRLTLDWIHCLLDTLCFAHSRGLSFGNIRPSTILINQSNHVFFSDFGRLNPENIASDGPVAFDKEAYDYAAPEQWHRPSSTRPPRGLATSMTTDLDTEVTRIRSAASSLKAPSISSRSSDNRPISPRMSANSQIDMQAADIYSFGCIIVELLGYLLKRQSRNFAAHRSAKHRAPGRGGAVLDSSFHKNPGQVESWMFGLARDAEKKSKDDQVFRGFAPMLRLVKQMLAVDPSARPSAFEVQTKMYSILTGDCGIEQPHCVNHYNRWDFGMGSLRSGLPKARISTAFSQVTAAPRSPTSSNFNHTSLLRPLTIKSITTAASSNESTLASKSPSPPSKHTSIFTKRHKKQLSNGSSTPSHRTGSSRGAGMSSHTSALSPRKPPPTIPTLPSSNTMTSWTPHHLIRQQKGDAQPSLWFHTPKTPTTPTTPAMRMPPSPRLGEEVPMMTTALNAAAREDEHERGQGRGFPPTPSSPHFPLDDEDGGGVHESKGRVAEDSVLSKSIPSSDGHDDDHFELGSGLRAIRDLRIRKMRPTTMWNAAEQSPSRSAVLT